MKTVKVNGYDLAIKEAQLIKHSEACEILDDMRERFARLAYESKNRERAYAFSLKFLRKLAQLERQFDLSLEFIEHEIF